LSGGSEQNNSNQKSISNDESDPCGNSVGNGYEIISGNTIHI
jgi:hypothetical protein